MMKYIYILYLIYSNSSYCWLLVYARLGVCSFICLTAATVALAAAAESAAPSILSWITKINGKNFHQTQFSALFCMWSTRILLTGLNNTFDWNTRLDWALKNFLFIQCLCALVLVQIMRCVIWQRRWHRFQQHNTVHGLLCRHRHCRCRRRRSRRHSLC